MKPEIPVEVVDFMAASARDYVLELLREPSLINALVEPRLQQLIAGGDIIPRERLQLGVGLELAPLGLEQAARALIAAAVDIDMPEMQGFAEAVAALTAVLERVEAPAIPAATPEETDGAESTEEPVADEHRCIICNDVVDEEQRLTSFTRWRKILCKDHHAVYDPKKSLDSYKPKATRKKAS